MKNKIHYIYKITLLCGKLAGKYYIGKHSTTNKNDGYAGSGKIVVDYYKKYGKKKNITYIKEIIEYNQTMVENAEREKIIIGNLWKSDNNCVNCCEGGSTGGLHFKPWNKGKKGCFSDETIKKMSNAKKGKTSTFKGKHHTEESKEKIGNASRGRVTSEETKRKIGEKSKGHTLSPEARKKISNKSKGRKHSEEAKIKMMIPIVQYSLDGDYMHEWNGATEVENTIGISHKQIWKCLKGHRKQVSGYIWKYKEAV